MEIVSMQQFHQSHRKGHRVEQEQLLRAAEHRVEAIACEIHDGLAQQLAGAILQLDTYTQQRGRDAHSAAKAFDAGMHLLRQGHCEARRLISGARLPILDKLDILHAVAHLVHDPAFADGPKVEFQSRLASQRLEPALAHAVYRIVQEGLTNIRKHSQSPEARVSLTQRQDTLQIRIEDWGIGFACEDVGHRGFGLESIRHRAWLLGGQCTIRSKPGRGTVVTVAVPVGDWDESP